MEIGTVAACSELAEALLREKGTIAVDFEGHDLSRSGELYVVIIARSPDDVHLVKLSAIERAEGGDLFVNGRLKEVMESNEVKKLWFDVRSDYDYLFHKRGVKPNNVFDVQVACFEKYLRPKKFDRPTVPGLLKSVEFVFGRGSNEATQVRNGKERGLQLFAPERGGSYEVWNQPNLQRELVVYATGDVRHLFAMCERTRAQVSEKKMTAAVMKRMAHMRAQVQPAGETMRYVDW